MSSRPVAERYEHTVAVTRVLDAPRELDALEKSRGGAQ
jgi:hypothetical protein